MSEDSQQLSFLSTPSRQSSVAILLILLKFSKIIFRQAWPVLLVVLFRQGRNDSTQDYFWTYAILIIGAGTALLSIIAYFKFYFYVEGEELVIEKGVIQKTKLNIPFDRIQTVNFNQNIIHKIFNVVSLEIDTAGSKGNEFSITALGKEKAEQIRNYLLAQKSEIHSVEEGIETELQTEEEEVLLQLSPTDLIKLGVGQNHFRTGGIIIAFFIGIGQIFEDVLGDEIYDTMKDVTGFDSGNFILYGLTMGLLFIIASFLFTLIRTFLTYYDLKFLKTLNGFKVIAGLFTRKERSAVIQKIQLVQWSTNPVKKIFQLFDVQLSQASSSMVAQKQSLYVPGCYASQLNAVRDAYFPEEQNIDFEEHRIHKSMAMRRFLYTGLLPGLGLGLLTFRPLGWGALVWLIWIVFIFVTSRILYKNWRYYLSEEGLRTNTKIIVQRNNLLKWSKVQGVQIRQSIYQRRKNLADITFYTAAGSVKLPYIELSKARKIKDFVLYKVESNKGAWM